MQESFGEEEAPLCLYCCEHVVGEVSLGARVHWPVFLLRMTTQGPVLTVRRLGTSGSLGRMGGRVWRGSGLESEKGLGEWQATLKTLAMAGRP